MKEIHVWLSSDVFNRVNYDDTYFTLHGAEDAIKNGYDDIVHTTQTKLLKTEYLNLGYKIFVHLVDNEVVEVKLGCNNTWTSKEIRLSHNIEKMVLANLYYNS